MTNTLDAASRILAARHQMPTPDTIRDLANEFIERAMKAERRADVASELLEAIDRLFGHAHIPECPHLDHLRKVIARAEGRQA